MEITFAAKVVAVRRPHRLRATVYVVLGVSFALIGVMQLARGRRDFSPWLLVGAVGAFVAAHGELRPTVTSQVTGRMRCDGRFLQVLLPASVNQDGRLGDQLLNVEVGKVVALGTSHGHVRLTATSCQVATRVGDGDWSDARVLDQQTIAFLTDERGASAIRGLCDLTGIPHQS